MSEVLSMHSIKPARTVKNKKGEVVFRCGWGRHEGTGCQETLGTLDPFVNDGSSSGSIRPSYSRIRLELGYDTRGDHSAEAIFFFSKRPQNRTHHSVALKETFKNRIAKTIKQREEFIETYGGSMDADDPIRIDLQSLETGQGHLHDARNKWKRQREQKSFYLVNEEGRPAWPGTGERMRLRPFEFFLPATIRCKACGHLSRITNTGEIP